MAPLNWSFTSFFLLVLSFVLFMFFYLGLELSNPKFLFLYMKIWAW